MKTTIITLIALATAVPVASAVAQDDNAAAERARLANQRIFAETERRNREEAGETETVAVPPTGAATPAPEPVESTAAPANVEARAHKPAAALVETPPAEVAPEAPPAEASGSAVPAGPEVNDMDAILEQIRTLGELRDKGYVTDEEFDRIKRRLLEKL